jgi:homoserine kinase
VSGARSATAFAPASIGNVAVGFDLLGLAIEGVGDRVTIERRDAAGIVIDAVEGDRIGVDAASLSRDPERNTASIAAAALWRERGDGGGLRLRLSKGTPLGSGMGSSAASAVAGAVAANALLPEPLDLDALLPYALAGEEFASQATHADNVAPSLLGGLTLSPLDRLPGTIRIPVLPDVVSVLVHPHLRIETAAARRVLKSTVELHTVTLQQGHLATFISACYAGDAALLGACLRDVMIEPQRIGAVTGFADVQRAALGAGAYGCSLSGSGPSLFALAPRAAGDAVRTAMRAAFDRHGLASDAWVSAMGAPGARVESIA